MNRTRPTRIYTGQVFLAPAEKTDHPRILIRRYVEKVQAVGPSGYHWTEWADTLDRTPKEYLSVDFTHFPAYVNPRAMTINAGL